MDSVSGIKLALLRLTLFVSLWETSEQMSVTAQKETQKKHTEVKIQNV